MAATSKPFIPYLPVDDVPNIFIFHSNLTRLDPIALITHYLPALLLIVLFNIPPTPVYPGLTKIEKTAMAFSMIFYFNSGT